MPTLSEPEPITRPWPTAAALVAGLAAAVLLLWSYDGLAHHWYWWHEVSFWQADRFRMEVPLILALLLVGAWPAGRSGMAWFLGGLAGVFPLLGAMVAVDLCGRILNRVPSLLDLLHLRDLLHADPWLGTGVLLALLAALSPPFIVFACWCRGRAWQLRLAALGLRLSLVSCLLVSIWSPSARTLWLERTKCHTWSDLHNLKDRGPLTTTFAITARAFEARRRLAALPAAIAVPTFPTPSGGRAHAIHLLLLESFVDPRELTPPIADSIHPDLLALLGPGGRFDTCTSPVFGGGSAQAEFELLTGAPALAAIGPIEYAWVTGKRPVDGLVVAANAAGYRTVLTYGAESVFFNAWTAHRALGFSERHYADHDPWGGKRAEDMFITDADLTGAVLDRLAGSIDGRPVLSLTVGMEGHVLGNGWFPRDGARFPDRVVCDEGARGLANLCYWRSQAIAAWFTRIARQDPEAVALALADHQPTVLGGALRHRRDRNAIPALMRVGDRRVSVDGRRICDLPWLVWREAGGGNGTPPHESALMRRYEAIVAAQLRE